MGLRTILHKLTGFEQMNKKIEVKLIINSEWCKGCGICVAFCPKRVLELNHKDKSQAVRVRDCIACMMCELRCPDLAIEVITSQPQMESANDNPTC